MDTRRRRNWNFEAEIGGAFALGAGGAVSALLAAPAVGAALPFVVGAAGVAGMAVGWLVVRRSGSGTVRYQLPDFDLAPFASASTDANERMRRNRVPTEPSIEPGAHSRADDDALLLDQPVDPRGLQSRLVALFGASSTPTAGDLQQRIDAHLAGEPLPETIVTSVREVPDASDDLYAALHDLRRSLRAR